MAFSPVFLSIVFVVRNQSTHVEKILSNAVSYIAPLVADYEIIIVDNASEDDSISTLKTLTKQCGLPNLQIYALTKEVDSDTASWVGLENALGDFIAVINPLTDDIKFLPYMLDEALNGADAVFADNQLKPPQSFAYRVLNAIFNGLYRRFNGIDLAKEAPQYRVLSKRVVNFILQHSHPAMTYRHLPVTGGFARVNLSYSTTPDIEYKKRIGQSVNLGMRLLVSSTRAPMRLVTLLCLFGAVANLIYSIYVVVIFFMKPDIASGWASISLQQSGMFFLISLVLLVLGEYVIQMASLSNEGPLYHIGQEFTSARMTRHEKLNIEEGIISPTNTSTTTLRDLPDINDEY